MPVKIEDKHYYDVIVIGAGAAGMMCALQAGRRERRVLLLERSADIGRKIRISGGGRCNFTNLDVGSENYVSDNPHFCRSALARFTPDDFIAMVRQYKIAFHEKKLGQLFCDESAQQIIDMLITECKDAKVTILTDCRVKTIKKEELFITRTDKGDFNARSVVIATGGLSVPKIGATDFGYRIAKSFGLEIIETNAALDAFVFSEADQSRFNGLSGVSLPVRINVNEAEFNEQLLFTHTGLSGPAVLQASLYWHDGDSVRVDLMPDKTVKVFMQWFAKMRKTYPRRKVPSLLTELFPKRVAERFCEIHRMNDKPAAEQKIDSLENFCKGLKGWDFIPKGTVGYRAAEVTRGGVDTNELSSKTMESKKVPGLYFIGEVVDVTGWLGGYNFQWAWASGWAAGQAV